MHGYWFAITNHEQREIKNNSAHLLKIFPELYYQKEDYKTELVGYALIGKQLVYKIQITGPNGFTTTNFYDVQSGLKIKSTNESAFFFTGESIYDNYQEVDGIKFPFSIIDGGHSFLKVKEIKINTGLSDALFHK